MCMAPKMPKPPAPIPLPAPVAPVQVQEIKPPPTPTPPSETATYLGTAADKRPNNTGGFSGLRIKPSRRPSSVGLNIPK